MMQNKSHVELPQIFKIINIIGVLKYYGYLDGWKRLLTRLNTKTTEVWINHKTAFINYGREYRRDIEL